MSEIEVRHLSKTFTQKDLKVDALSDINICIEKGDVYGIIGMSGAGKSTLVRCLNYLERPTDGQVIVSGQELGALSEQKDVRIAGERPRDGHSLLLSARQLAGIALRLVGKTDRFQQLLRPYSCFLLRHPLDPERERDIIDRVLLLKQVE